MAKCAGLGYHINRIIGVIIKQLTSIHFNSTDYNICVTFHYTLSG